MDRKKALDIIATIMDEAGISAESLIDFVVDRQDKDNANSNRPKTDTEILSEALADAKEITGLEDQDIGKIVGVTGGAVGHWRRGRTRPSSQNRRRIYEWLRSVEGALAVRLLPGDFRINENGDQAHVH